MRSAGVGGVSRRSPEAICEELATLYHERDVRYFYFVDEHLLPHDEQAALEYLAAWKDGLQRRGVGPLGIGTMLRADRLTPRLVHAFADVGLVRTFVGLEFASDAEAVGYARKTSVAGALQLLRTFAEAGVATVSNVMLLHPDSTPATLHHGIDFLRQIPAGVFEIVRMMPYHGTQLSRRLQDEGRLRGNPLRYSYTYDDGDMERFGQIFNRLRAEAFFDHSVAFRTHDVHLALALQRRLEPDAALEPVASRLESVRGRVNQLYVRSLRNALALAEAGAGALQATSLVVQARDATKALIADLQHCERKLLIGEPHGQAQLFSPMRAAAGAAFVLGMATTAGLPACGSKVIVDGSGGAGTSSSTSSSSSTSTSSSTSVPITCTAEIVEQQKQQVRVIVGQEQPCFSGYLMFKDGTNSDVEFGPSNGSGDPVVLLCNGSANLLAKAAMEEAVADALEGQVFPCLGTDDYGGYVDVDGGAGAQAASMMDTVHAACPDYFYESMGSIAILLDATGAVVGVTVKPGHMVPDGVLQCVKTALDGLTFPCLAGYEICPEFVIAE